MRHDLLTRPASIDADTTEKARRAVAAFRRLQPTLSTYAQVLTGDKTVRVDMAARDNGSTDGKRIYFRPPLALGDNTPHDKLVCDKRGSDGLMLCRACAIREEVLVTIYHEIAHIAFDSFAEISEEDKKRAVEHVLNEVGGAYADRVRASIEARRPTSYIGLAQYINEYFPYLVNCLEDARVNAALFKARPGVRKMFDADTFRIFEAGYECRAADGSVFTQMWNEAPLNTQVMVGMFCKASGYNNYNDWFHADVVAALNDATLTSLVRSMDTIRSASAVYNLSFKVLLRLRELGFLATDRDPDPEPEPEEENDDEPETSDQPNAPSPGKPDSDPVPGDDGTDDVLQPNESGADGGSDGDEAGSSEADSDAAEEGDDSSSGDGDDSEDGDGEGNGTSESDAPGESDDRGTDSDAASGSEDADPTAGPGDGSTSGDGDGEWRVGNGGERSEGGSRDSADGEGDDSDGDVDGNSGPVTSDYSTTGDISTADGEAPIEDGDALDTGADDGYGGTSLEGESKPQRPDFGTPDEIPEVLAKWGDHEEKPKTVAEKRAEQAVDTAIIQGIYFTKPSSNIHGVREHWYDKHWTDAVGNDYAIAWTRRATPRRAGRDSDLDVPETVLQPALGAMRRAFSDNQRGGAERHKRSGHVNKRALGKRAPLGDDRLFLKRTLPAKKDYHVVIGMDISGSTYGVNLALEKRAIFTQAELLHRTGISFAIYAHTGNYADAIGGAGLSLDVYHIKDPHEKWTDKVQKRLHEIGPSSANLDGHAMEFLRKRCEESSATEKVLLYYSDGKMPCENHDEELDLLTSEIKLCRNRGITLLGVGIRTDSPARHGLDTVEVHEDSDLVKVVQQLGKRLSS